MQTVNRFPMNSLNSNNPDTKYRYGRGQVGLGGLTIKIPTPLISSVRSICTLLRSIVYEKAYRSNDRVQLDCPKYLAVHLQKLIDEFDKVNVQ